MKSMISKMYVVRLLGVFLCGLLLWIGFAPLVSQAKRGQGRKAKSAAAARKSTRAAKRSRTTKSAAGGAVLAREDARPAFRELASATADEDARNLAGEDFGREEGEGEAERADEPGKAMEHFLRKRLPEGEAELPLERYLDAVQEMTRMPVYATAESRLLAPGALAKAAPDQPRLGAWTALGPGNIGGRTRAIVFHPQNPSIIYAGAVTGGVWKSVDAGQTWAPLSDQFSNVSVSTIALEPGNPNVIYAGTGEGYEIGSTNGVNITGGYRGLGIYKSTDAGASWTRLASTASSDFYYVNDLAVSTSAPQRVYAATQTGVWRSLDGGATWTQAHNPGLRGGCLDLAIRTDQPTDVVFASCGTLSQAHVYRNPDAGGTGAWTDVLADTGMGRTALSIAPSNQNVIYAIATAYTGGFTNSLHAVFRSTSGGEAGSWSARVRNTDPSKINRGILSNAPDFSFTDCKLNTADSISGQGWYDLAIAVDPVDENRVWVGGIDLFRSDDGGANWGLAGFVYVYPSSSTLSYGKPDQIHPDQHVIVFPPQYNGATNQQMFVGNDGGLWRTDNARDKVGTGPTGVCSPANSLIRFTALNNSYAPTQFYHGAVAPDGKSYLGGTQDNGTVRGTDAGGPNAWSRVVLADGGYTGIDFLNPATLYASIQGARFWKSTDTGASFSSATLGLTLGTALFITPLVMDPSDPKRIYTGGDLLNRTDNGMSTWTSLGSLRTASGTSGTLSALAIAPTDANYGLFGLNNGVILRTTRALALGASTQLSNGVETVAQPRSGYVSWLTFDPADRNIAYATYSTFGGAHVWRTVNGGGSWASIDGSGAGALPDIPVHCLVVDPSNTARLYIGTDVGVFASVDGGANWAVENTGFPNVLTETLVANVAGGVTSLYAFTHGRGAFRVTANLSGCNYALSSTGRAASAAGGDVSVGVTAAPGGCGWKAESNATWISVKSGASGSANGTVALTIAPNTGAARRYGTVAIAGRSFAVVQEGLADLDAPTLSVALPSTSTVTTTLPVITLAGVASDNVRVASVNWRSNRGGAGAASGTASWTISNVPILTGRNEITITAADDAGNLSVPKVLVVTCQPAAVLTTVAGNGVFGYGGENIPAAGSSITNPSGTMFFDAGGNYYFADFNGARARKVSAAGLITTVAGNGVAGFSGDGGKATDAQLSQPRGVLADASGNVFVLDSGNQRIRRVSAGTGIINTYAGFGIPGFSGDGGPATGAQFDFGGLGAIALDSAGNLLVADSNNNRIRRIAADTGIVTTLAGSGAGFGGDGGPASAALLRSPQSIYTDKDGNIFFADSGNFRIRKIAVGTGIITTVAGTGVSGISGDGGPATDAQFGTVFGIALDAARNLYLSDVSSNRIRRVSSADGMITTVAGGGATGFTPDGAGALGASLSLARHLGVDPLGFLYIAEANNFRIRKLVPGLSNDATAPVVSITDPTATGALTSSSAVLTLRGTAADNGAVVLVRWSNDRGGAGAASGTNAWAASGIGLYPGLNNVTVTAWDVSGNAGSARLAVTYAPQKVVVTIAGTGAIADRGDGGPGTGADLNQPRGVAIDSKGNIYIADTQNRRVRKVTPAGQIIAYAGTGELGSGGDGGPAAAATLNFPNVVIVDKADNLYICDQLAHRIRKVTPDGIISTFAGTGEAFGAFGGDGGPATAAQFNGPIGLALDKDGNMFVADRLNYRIRRIDGRTGIITTVAGTGLFGSDGDGGPATQANLTAPTGVAVDGAGNLYIADTGNQRIRRVDAADGKIRTIAGQGAASYAGDGGPAVNAYVNLAYPATMAIDSAGDLYFADRGNHVIRKIALGTGIITTAAGIGVASFNGDGTAPEGTALSFPTSVAFDAVGNLIIADSGNNRVRRVRPAADVKSATAVSAASFLGADGLSAESLGAVFGTNLASGTVVATGLPLPTTLAGTTVRVLDNLGTERPAPLFFVSPGQINIQIPAGTATGIATVAVTNAAGETALGTIQIAGVSPGLFSANANGQGVAAAVALRRTAAGADSFEPVAKLDSATGKLVSLPIDLGPEGDQVFLILYGTGVRGVSALANAQATIGGLAAPVLYAGPAPGLIGTDQLNLRLDRALAGRGEVDVLVRVDGATANVVRIAIK